jgi:hypothetical protein
MKYILIIFLFCSCSRDPISQNAVQPEISFEVNSKHYVFAGEAKSNRGFEIGVYGKKHLTSSNPGPFWQYQFDGYKEYENQIGIYIRTDSLLQTTYQNQLGVSINLVASGESYSSLDRQCSITITEYKNGFASGTFAGNFYNNSPSRPGMTITNGKISNVQIHFQ